PFIEILGLRLGPEQPDERIAAQSVEYAPPEKVIGHSQPWIGLPVDGGLILPAGGIKTRPRQVAINQAGRRSDKEDRGGTTTSASGYHRLTLRCSVTPHQSAARARARGASSARSPAALAGQVAAGHGGTAVTGSTRPMTSKSARLWVTIVAPSSRALTASRMSFAKERCARLAAYRPIPRRSWSTLAASCQVARLGTCSRRRVRKTSTNPSRWRRCGTLRAPTRSSWTTTALRISWGSAAA